MARQEGKHIVAVEPQPGNLIYLYANFLANNWNDAEIFPLGLGATPRILPLFGASSTGASLIPGWAGASRRYRRTIPVTTMDILLGERFRGKKLFIKIDVEGVEYDVLRGAKRTLNLDPKPTWMVEICLREFHPGGENPHYAATFGMFWENGYEARTADDRHRPVTPYDIDLYVRNGQGIPGAINFFFTPVGG
jgi:FkbM family methyltransferase